MRDWRLFSKIRHKARVFTPARLFNAVLAKQRHETHSNCKGRRMKLLCSLMR
jgi:hypothetical protein